MRDNLKDKNYFETYIKESYESFQKSNERIKNGVVPNDRILIVKRSMADSFLQIISAKYSLGNPVGDLKDDLLKAIDLTNESWDGFWKLKFEGRTLNQYILTAYDEMLWMLSLGYLLDIKELNFKKLVEVIDRDGIRDYLFEFIIRAKIKDRKPINKESYEYSRILFGKIRQAITETEKNNAEKLIKGFITKDWYKEHKDCSWYNSHTSKHDTYSGYWSFETAAVVKIMGLDDSSFRDCPYYPKDLLDFGKPQN